MNRVGRGDICFRPRNMFWGGQVDFPQDLSKEHFFPLISSAASVINFRKLGVHILMSFLSSSTCRFFYGSHIKREEA